MVNSELLTCPETLSLNRNIITSLKFPLVRCTSGLSIPLPFCQCVMVGKALLFKDMRGMTVISFIYLFFYFHHFTTHNLHLIINYF